MHTEDDHVYGYIRLTSFSQHAAEDMRRAIVQVSRLAKLRMEPGRADWCERALGRL